MQVERAGAYACVFFEWADVLGKERIGRSHGFSPIPVYGPANPRRKNARRKIFNPVNHLNFYKRFLVKKYTKHHK
jgi:hypothetical protein